MLKNLTPFFEQGQKNIGISKEHNFEYTPQYDSRFILEEGVYVANIGYNFSHNEFVEFKDMANIPYDASYRLFAPNYEKIQYGVADSIEQIKEYFSEEVNDTEKTYFIVITPVFQEKEIREGWRWGKWGEYIGKLDSKCEYLNDEDFGDDFKCVFCFHIYPIN